MLVNSDVCRVRLDSLVTFEDGVARLSKTAVEKKYERPWTAYQVVHGQVGTIAFITLHDDWQSLGAQTAPATLFEDVLGEKEGRKHFAAVNACLEQIESIVAVDRPELSCADAPPAAATPPPMMQFTQIGARPGGQEACEELILKVAEAIRKVDDPTRFRTYQTLAGDRLRYGIAFPLQGLGDLDQQLAPPDLLTKAFGAAEGGKILRSGREAMESLETNISVYREDLSNPRR